MSKSLLSASQSAFASIQTTIDGIPLNQFSPLWSHVRLFHLLRRELCLATLSELLATEFKDKIDPTKTVHLSWALLAFCYRFGSGRVREMLFQLDTLESMASLRMIAKADRKSDRIGAYALNLYHQDNHEWFEELWRQTEMNAKAQETRSYVFQSLGWTQEFEKMGWQMLDFNDSESV